MKKLAQASVAARNAAFNVVFARLEKLIGELPFFQSQARAKLESPEGRSEVLAAVDEALAAAEKADAAPPPVQKRV